MPNRQQELISRLLSLGLLRQPSFYDLDAESNGRLESLLHEAAHMVVLGLDPAPFMSHRIGSAIDQMRDLPADWQEIQTIAVQMVVSERLGVELDDWALYRFAAPEMGSGRFKDRPDRVEAAVKHLLRRSSTQRRVERLLELISKALA